MKTLLFILSLSMVVSCNQGKSSKSKKSSSMGNSNLETTQEIQTFAELEQNSSLSEISNAIVSDNESCEFTAKKNWPRKYDLYLDSELTDKILTELKTSSVEKQEFVKEDFWLNLTTETAKELSDAILLNFTNSSEENYTLIKNTVAQSLIMLLAEDQPIAGYDIQLDEIGENESVSIAFFKKAKYKNRKKVNPCGQLLAITDASFNENKALDDETNTVSEVSSLISCIHEKSGHKVDLKVLNSAEVFLNVQVNEIQKEYVMNIQDIEGKSRNRSASLKMNSDGDEIKLKINKKFEVDNRRRGASARVYQPNTIDKLKIIIKNENGKTSSKTMKCTTGKQLIFEQ